MRSTCMIKARARRNREHAALRPRRRPGTTRAEEAAMASTFQPTTAPDAVQGLPQVFDPSAADGVEAVVLFDLSGREPGLWTVQIRDRTCRVSAGRTMDPTVTLSMDSDVWLAIARGEKSGKDA